MKESWNNIQTLRKWLGTFETDYVKWKNRYDRADRELAEVDGRYKKIPERVAKPPLSMENLILTQDQIAEVAKRLGINLPPIAEEEETDGGEDVEGDGAEDTN